MFKKSATPHGGTALFSYVLTVTSACEMAILDLLFQYVP